MRLPITKRALKALVAGCNNDPCAAALALLLQGEGPPMVEGYVGEQSEPSLGERILIAEDWRVGEMDVRQKVEVLVAYLEELTGFGKEAPSKEPQ